MARGIRFRIQLIQEEFQYGEILLAEGGRMAPAVMIWKEMYPLKLCG